MNLIQGLKNQRQVDLPLSEAKVAMRRHLD